MPFRLHKRLTTKGLQRQFEPRTPNFLNKCTGSKSLGTVVMIFNILLDKSDALLRYFGAWTGSGAVMSNILVSDCGADRVSYASGV